MTVTAASSDDSTATTAPSEETASPDAEATETPAETTTLGEFVSLTATKADTLTAVFDSAVPADATVVVENQYGTVSGSSSIDDTTITFTGTASFSEDTYTMTVSYGDASKSASTEVVAEYVASIEILSDEALTGGTGKDSNEKEISNVDAYIYYEVYNQYGESLKETTTVTWTISSGDSYSVDKSKGRITVSKNNEAWTYGDLIAVVGVYVGSSGKTANVSKTVTVGLAQALDTIEFVGFLSEDDKTTIETTLPADFAKDKWYLLYTAKDQQGNEMDAAEYVTNKNVTFVSDAPLLIDSTSFVEAGTKTVNSVDYAAVTIQPGTYVDKGGEVNITAISTGTGTKTTKNYVIGANGVLQSLVLQSPSSTIANGDQSVSLGYEATDTDGNSVTNYETIVRSSNTLTLKASQGTITISENADGTAKITWSDKYQATESGETDYVFANSECYDGTDSLVSLTTVVVGGESNNTLISVSDARIPTTISAYNDGANYNGYVVTGDEAYINVYSFVFLDQYGATMNGWDSEAVAFSIYSAETGIGDNTYGIRYTVSSSAMTLNGSDAVTDSVNCGTYWGWTILKGNSGVVDTCAVTMYIVKTDEDVSTTDAEDWDTVSDAGYYNIKVDVTSGNSFSASDLLMDYYTNTWCGNEFYASLTASAANGTDVETETVKYSIVKTNSKFTSSDSLTTYDSDKWDEVSKVKSVTYEIVPVAKLKNLNLGTYSYSYLQLQSNGTDDGYDGQSDSDALGAWVDTSSKTTYYVTGTYKSTTLTVPIAFYDIDAESDLTNTGKATDNGTYYITGLTSGALYWSDLYNTNTGERKTADLELVVDVYSVTDVTDAETQLLEPLTATVTASDEASVATSICLQQYYSDVSSITFKPNNTSKTISSLFTLGNGCWGQGDSYMLCVLDQYGVDISENVKYKINNIVENTNSLAHMDSSFSVKSNGTADASISGAEIGDTFTLTIIAKDDSSVTKTVNMTVGGDAQAYITSGSSGSGSYNADDEDANYGDLGLRKYYLGYNR